MTRADLQKVRAIGRETRAWAERVAKRTGEYPRDLCGMCAIAAGRLHKELRKAGFESVLAANSGHCFVLVKGYVVDVTATQFEGFERRKVVVERFMKVHWHEHWNINKTSTSRREMRQYQLAEGWPSAETVATPCVIGA